MMLFGGLITKKIGIVAAKSQFYNVLDECYHVQNATSKKWEPDEAFFNFERNTIFIVEKKVQTKSGSTDEKILGFANKRRLYQLNFNQVGQEPKPQVEFCALFNSAWWKRKKYEDYLDTLRIDGIRIFFDNYEYWWFGL